MWEKSRILLTRMVDMHEIVALKVAANNKIKVKVKNMERCVTAKLFTELILFCLMDFNFQILSKSRILAHFRVFLSLNIHQVDINSSIANEIAEH